jgi:hypothetical protein
MAIWLDSACDQAWRESSVRCQCQIRVFLVEDEDQTGLEAGHLQHGIQRLAEHTPQLQGSGQYCGDSVHGLQSDGRLLSEYLLGPPDPGQPDGEAAHQGHGYGLREGVSRAWTEEQDPWEHDEKGCHQGHEPDSGPQGEGGVSDGKNEQDSFGGVSS